MRELEIVPGTYCISKLRYLTRADLIILMSEPFYSVSKSPEETTVICRKQISGVFDHVKESSEDDFAAIRISGQIEFFETGVIAAISDILAKAEISIFAISTFDTDYILVKQDKLSDATETLSNAGYKISSMQKAA